MAFLFNPQTQPTYTDPLPETVDVAIIGAGVIGISTAWFLREQGLSVLVCDKGVVAGEQSSRNWGWVRVTWRDPAEVPIAIDSLKCWEHITSQLDEDVGFQRAGIMALASSEEEMAELAEWREFAKTHDLEIEQFGADKVQEHIRISSANWLGGTLTRSDAKAEPFKAVPAFARHLHKNGLFIREHCAVKALDVEGGKVAGIVTEHGRVRARQVVCAAGVWSSRLLNSAGICLPQLGVRGTVVRTAEAPEVFGGAVALTDLFVRRRQDGGYTLATGMTQHSPGPNSVRFFRQFLPSRHSTHELKLKFGADPTQRPLFCPKGRIEEPSPFCATRVLDPEPSQAGVDLIRRRLVQRVPELAEVPFAQTWAGMIDATPDVVPVMDAVDSLEGLFLATGFSGHGFGFGPGAGRVMADLVTGAPARFDLNRFRFSRFSDGSKMEPGPAI